MTIRLARSSHHPPAEPSIDSKLTSKPSDRANAANGSSSRACESPVSGSHGGSSDACSIPSIGATCRRSNTEMTLKKTRVSDASSPSLSGSLIGIGATIRIAFSPLRTQ